MSYRFEDNDPIYLRGLEFLKQHPMFAALDRARVDRAFATGLDACAFDYERQDKAVRVGYAIAIGLHLLEGWHMDCRRFRRAKKLWEAHGDAARPSHGVMEMGRARVAWNGLSIVVSRLDGCRRDDPIRHTRLIGGRWFPCDMVQIAARTALEVAMGLAESAHERLKLMATSPA